VTSALDALGLTIPVLAAPMAGGAGSVDLVVAAADAGGMGQLAAGYLTAEALASRIAETAARTTRFGVNLFAPNPVPISPEAYAAYARAIAPDGEAHGVDTTAVPLRDDDDAWDAKLAAIAEHPVPLVSFTFGLPSAEVVARLRRDGTIVVQTVTTPEEARAAAALGVDLVTVQAGAAGGHSGTLDPSRPVDARPLPELVRAVRSAVDLPVIAAGGIGGPSDVADALDAGATAVAVGTLLLRSAESDASSVHRAALADPRFTGTAVTRAYTGRPARGLRTRFMDEHADAPLGYPALHHLTSPLRKAAAAAGDAERLHLWAGTGFRAAREAPATEILRGLATEA
jgi:nitronate monooxygenase